MFGNAYVYYTICFGFSLRVCCPFLPASGGACRNAHVSTTHAALVETHMSRSKRRRSSRTPDGECDACVAELNQASAEFSNLVCSDALLHSDAYLDELNQPKHEIQMRIAHRRFSLRRGFSLRRVHRQSTGPTPASGGAPASGGTPASGGMRSAGSAPSVGFSCASSTGFCPSCNGGAV